MNKLLNKFEQYIITSSFGERIHPVTKKKSFHNGVDIVGTNDGKVGYTDNIKAHTGGIVETVSYNATSGNYIVIRVDKVTTMHYLHLKNKPNFSVGDKVDEGQILGYMGQTGRATGAHLHWGIKVSGQWIDPTQYIEEDYPTIKDNLIPTPKQGYTQNIEAEITASVLNVRKGPGTSFDAIATLKKGEKVKIIEHQEVIGSEWGRFEKGWISLKYTKLTITEEKIFINISLPMLVRGDKGEEVKTLQTLLLSHGYEMKNNEKVYGIDGSFGSATEKALKQYQLDNNLNENGYVGLDTWNSILQ